MKKFVVFIVLLVTVFSCFSIVNASTANEKLITTPTNMGVNSEEKSSTVIKQNIIDSQVAEELFVLNGFSQEDKRKEIVLKARDIDSSKEYIYDRMLNSIDYFNTLQATYCYEDLDKSTYYSTYCIDFGDVPKSKELIYEDSGELLTENIFDGTFYTKLDLMEDSVIKKQSSSRKIKTTSKEDICKDIIGDRSTITAEELAEESMISKNYIDVVSNKELDFVSNVASKSRIKYLPETKNDTFYYRDNTAMLPKSNIQYFPQDFAFGFLSDFDNWTIARTEELLGRECFVIIGSIDGYYSEKMGTKEFEMWVDKAIGALIMMKGVDDNGDLSVQLTTSEFVVDEPIAKDVFDDLSNL